MPGDISIGGEANIMFQPNLTEGEGEGGGSGERINCKTCKSMK